MIFDRQPPFNYDAERAVLGAMMLDGEAAMTAVATIPGPEAFYSLPHQHIFRAMADVVEQEGSADITVLGHRMMSAGSLEQSGGGAYLADVSGAVPTSANIDYYLRIVVDLYKLRQIIDTCRTTAIKAQDMTEVVILLDELQTGIEEIAKTPQDAPGDAISVSGAVSPLVDRVKLERASDGPASGILAGIKYLDERVGGMLPGELTLVAARTSVGKTALLMNVLVHNIENPVLMFSLEMDRNALIGRLISIMSGESFTEWGRGYSGNEHAIDAAALRLQQSRIHINDRPGLNIRQIRMHLARHVKSRGLPAFVAVDYIQLMQATDRRLSSVERISESSQGLKNLAREFEIPVLALAQINRDVPGGEPHLHHLKGSGSLEEDADRVIMLWREDEDAATVKAKIAKNRNGPTGSWAMNFHRASQTMSAQSNADKEAAAKEEDIWDGP